MKFSIKDFYRNCDLVIFTKEILNGKFPFLCSGCCRNFHGINVFKICNRKNIIFCCLSWKILFDIKQSEYTFCPIDLTSMKH